MSGVHHLAWRPTGPVVLARILEWLGFEATSVVFWRQNPSRADHGRIRIVGARDPAMLAGLATPPTATIVLPKHGDTVSGTEVLDADATDDIVTIDRVEFRLTGEKCDDALVGVVAPSVYGWIHRWDTTTVPNGTYTLNSVAIDTAGNAGPIESITLRVRN